MGGIVRPQELRIQPRKPQAVCLQKFKLARANRPNGTLASPGCLSVALWPAIGHQEAQKNTSRESIKVSSVAVNVYAIAEDHHGRLLRDLTKDDFQLTEDSVPQKIEYFSRETNMALSLGLAIDTSVSQGRLLGAEQEAAKKFVSEVLRSGDQAFVMNFDADVNLLKDFTDAAIDLSEAIDSAKINDTGRSILQQGAVPATGGTHLYDAVYLASSELMKARAGRKVLVLVTDGQNQGSKVNLQESIEAAEKADVIVYSIILSDPELYSLMGTSYHGDRSVRKIARETGGGTIQSSRLNRSGKRSSRSRASCVRNTGWDIIRPISAMTVHSAESR